MSSGYTTRKMTSGEWFGMIFGGGSIAAMLVLPVVFVARLAGLV